MKIAVLQFPGSNCERETSLAITRAGMIPVEFLWNEPKENLATFDGYVIVGGFSYEDRSRAGIIAALDPLMNELKRQSDLGKPILGICNGAQILVESGLVPGLENHKIALALTDNKRISNGKVLGTGYYNTWVNMRLSDQYQRNAFTRHLTPRHLMHIPIAHAEGRFVMTDAMWREIEAQGLHIFQYCDAQGQVIDSFPTNPNGSHKNIAAIANKAGNVLAMMPHPERSKNGDAIFLSMRDFILEGHADQIKSLDYYPRPTAPLKYELGQKYECLVELIITDNHALTVQNTLQQLGIPVTVKRRIHWEIDCATPVLNLIKQSGVLFNERKETEVKANPHRDEIALLVCPKENLIGQEKCQMLKDHFHLNGVNSINHGIVWQFKSEKVNITALKDKILHTNIICNPYAHDCYDYQPTNA